MVKDLSESLSDVGGTMVKLVESLCLSLFYQVWVVFGVFSLLLKSN